MKQLLEIQKNIQEYVLYGVPVMDTVDGVDLSFIETRLMIYREGYRARLIEMLGMDFPCVKSLLGEERFEPLLERYLEEAVSQHFLPQYLGEPLSLFLQRTELSADIVEMARYEYGLIEIQQKKEETPMSVADFAAIPVSRWPNMTFPFLSTLTCFSFSYPIPEMRDTISQGKSDGTAPRHISLLDYVVWRDRHHHIRHRMLEPVEKKALDCLIQGGTFQTLCEVLCAVLPESEVSERAVHFMMSWIELGWIVNPIPFQ